EDLDAVVARVGDVEQSVRPQGQRPGAGELSRLAARRPPTADEAAVEVELADALVLAELGDVEVTVAVLHHVTDVAELPRRGAGVAADLAQLLAVGRVDAEAVVVRIADDQVTVAVDAQPAGPAVTVIGRRPGRAEVTAVTVVDLDAGGEI